MNQIPMTVQGASQLKEELDNLKFNRRPAITKAIAAARELGDLKENAEYHAAREEQGLVEARIRQIESKLGNAQIIDITKIVNHDNKVIFGATVTVINVDTAKEVTYKIVGEDEADLKNNLISIVSPIARALIGKNVDDTVYVNTPSGDIEYDIVKVEYI